MTGRRRKSSSNVRFSPRGNQQRVPCHPPQASSVANQNNVLPSTPSSSSSSSYSTSTVSQNKLKPIRNLDAKRQSRRRRRQNEPFVWTLNCHEKYVEVAKQSGGIDKVSVCAVWEIMKAEMDEDDAIPTLNNASHIRGFLQSKFSKLTGIRPHTLVFYFGAQSEPASFDTVVSDFRQLKLAPKTEAGGGSCDSDTVVNDFGKLKFEETTPFD